MSANIRLKPDHVLYFLLKIIHLIRVSIENPIILARDALSIIFCKVGLKIAGMAED